MREIQGLDREGNPVDDVGDAYSLLERGRGDVASVEDFGAGKAAKVAIADGPGEVIAGWVRGDNRLLIDILQAAHAEGRPVVYGSTYRRTAAADQDLPLRRTNGAQRQRIFDMARPVDETDAVMRAAVQAAAPDVEDPPADIAPPTPAARPSDTPQAAAEPPPTATPTVTPITRQRPTEPPSKPRQATTLKLPAGMIARRPTGQPSWPVVLISGYEKSGKSFAAIELTADPRVGDAYLISVGETESDEYGGIPGADFQIIEHDGSIAQITAAVQAVTALPVDLARPPLLIIDPVSNIWTLLTDRADKQARSSKNARKQLDEDPDADVPVTAEKWNSAKRKWKGIMNPCLNWPGLVVLIARGAEVAEMDENGRPIPRKKTWKIEGHKTLPYDAQVLLQAEAPGEMVVTGAKTLQFRVPRNGLLLGEKPLADLLFNRMHLGGENMAARGYAADRIEESVSPNRAKDLLVEAVGGDVDIAKDLWRRAGLPDDEPLDVSQVEGLLEYAREKLAGLQRQAG